MRQIVLGTGTTGMDSEKGRRIIEIRRVELINCRRFMGSTYHSVDIVSFSR